MHESDPPHDPFRAYGIPGIFIAGICIFHASGRNWSDNDSLSPALATVYGSAEFLAFTYVTLLLLVLFRGLSLLKQQPEDGIPVHLVLIYIVGTMTLTSFMSFTIAALFL